jgi:hypothetical protein
MKFITLKEFFKFRHNFHLIETDDREGILNLFYYLINIHTDDIIIDTLPGLGLTIKHKDETLICGLNTSKMSYEYVVMVNTDIIEVIGSKHNIDYGRWLSITVPR